MSIDRRLDRIYISEIPDEPPSRAGLRPSSDERWRAHIQINGWDDPSQHLTIQEPPYPHDFNDYVTETANVLARTRSAPGFVREHQDLPRWHTGIVDYTRNLFDQLRLGYYRREKPGYFHRDARGCVIYVIEQHEKCIRRGNGLHSLKWELLEGFAPEKPWPYMYTIAVSRVVDFRKAVRRPHPNPLSELRRSEYDPVNILLVIARDLTRIGRNKDADPDLTQAPLMDLQEELNHGRTRVMLEIVRPGSLKALRDHLALRDKQRVQFNIIHFDLHGDDPGTTDPPSCRLVFATSRNSETPKGVVGGEESDAMNNVVGDEVDVLKSVVSEDVDAVAKLVEKFRIEHVVMTSCWSAYEGAGRVNSMAQLFIRANVRGVSAVWGRAGTDSVMAYNGAFYSALLGDEGAPTFEEAVHAARLAMRTDPNRWPEDKKYRDDFLYVYYARDDPRLPRPEVSRLSDVLWACNRFLVKIPRKIAQPFSKSKRRPRRPAAPVASVRLDLLTFELEAYLQGYRIVYASDSVDQQLELKMTIKGLARLWLRTNLVHQVMFYDEQRLRRWKQTLPEPREIMTRYTHGYALGHRLPDAIGGTIYVFEGLDDVFTGIHLGLDLAADVAARETIVRKMRDFLINLSEGEYAIILGYNEAETWMPKEWGFKFERTVQYWSHGSPAYTDDENWPDALQASTDYADLYSYGC